MTTSYCEVAAAEGAWTQALRLPAAAPVEQVRRALSEAARTSPVAAFLQGEADDPVEEVLLYRDPSRTYGTPDPSVCDTAVSALIAKTGWGAVAGQVPGGVLVGLGLREGYETGAAQHSPAEVTDHLRALSATGWSCRTARLVSARLVGRTVRWYAEDGVVVQAQPRLLPAIQAAALGCAQHRYVVTHLAAHRTYALQRSGDGGSSG